MPHAVSTERQDAVDTTVLEYDAMAVDWELLRDLLGGTRRMREMRTKWLPVEEAESSFAYDTRVSRSFLFNGYRNTVRRISSKPFVKSIVIGDDLPEQLQGIEADVDRTGTDITQLGKNMLLDGVVHGKTHLLVDFPEVPIGSTLADERELGARPLFVHVTAQQLIGWRTLPDPRGVSGQRLTMVRILEDSVEPLGRFIDRAVRRVRVYTEDMWEVWEEVKTKRGTEFVLVSGGIHSFGAVPLVTFYLTRTGFLTATPPLQEFAEVNLAHWQSSSDQRNYLRFIRMGLLFAAGFTKAEIKAGVTIGVNRMISSSNPEAKMAYVEHQGRAAEAGRTDIKDLEEQMEILGLQPLVSRTGDITATGKAIDENRAHTDVQAWVRSEENTLVEAYRFAARWIGEELSDDFTVDISSDFAISMKNIEDVKNLISARKMREISRETFLGELRRRGLLSEQVDVEEEIARIDDEGVALSEMIPDDDEGGEE